MSRSVNSVPDPGPSSMASLTEEEQRKIRVLASYVPKLVLKKFQLSASYVKPPFIENTMAAVLFADISGRNLSSKLTSPFVCFRFNPHQISSPDLSRPFVGSFPLALLCSFFPFLILSLLDPLVLFITRLYSINRENEPARCERNRVDDNASQ